MNLVKVLNRDLEIFCKDFKLPYTEFYHMDAIIVNLNKFELIGFLINDFSSFEAFSNEVERRIFSSTYFDKGDDFINVYYNSKKILEYYDIGYRYAIVDNIPSYITCKRMNIINAIV